MATKVRTWMGLRVLLEEQTVDGEKVYALAVSSAADSVAQEPATVLGDNNLTTGLDVAKSMAQLMGGAVPANTKLIRIFCNQGVVRVDFNSTVTPSTGAPILVNGWLDVPAASFGSATIIEAEAGSTVYAVAFDKVPR